MYPVDEWTVDLEKGLVLHRDGWVFQFSPVAGEPGSFDGKAIEQPSRLSADQIAGASRIAKEAGDAYIAARAARQ